MMLTGGCTRATVLLMSRAWLVRVDDVVEKMTEPGDEVTRALLLQELQGLKCYCPGCVMAWPKKSDPEDLEDELPF